MYRKLSRERFAAERFCLSRLCAFAAHSCFQPESLRNDLAAVSRPTSDGEAPKKPADLLRTSAWNSCTAAARPPRMGAERMENPSPQQGTAAGCRASSQADLFEQILHPLLGTRDIQARALLRKSHLDVVLETGAELGATTTVISHEPSRTSHGDDPDRRHPAENIFAGFETLTATAWAAADVKFTRAQPEFRIARQNHSHHLVSQSSQSERSIPLLGTHAGKPNPRGQERREGIFPSSCTATPLCRSGHLAETLNFAGHQGLSVGGAIR